MVSMRILPILILLAPTPVFAACHVEPFLFRLGSSSSASVSADSGSICTIHFHSNGRRVTGYDSVTISSAPKHGSANASGDSSDYAVTYKSAGGYKGSDQFSIAVKGSSSYGPGTADIQVNVDIH